MSASITITRATLGQQVPAIADVMTQLSNLLDDPTPGGLKDLQNQASSLISQVTSEIDRLQARYETLMGHINMIQTLVDSVGGALGEAGVARAEFSGDWAEVIAALEDRKGELAGDAQQVYGMLFLASTPGADRALSALAGLSRTLKLGD